MKLGWMRVSRHGTTGILSRVVSVLIALWFAQAAPQTAMAQQSASISPSVVLVLKLVSSTHVKPTTGIVVSDDGLVLVPADFAAAEGEMIVLDGGTDILSNGRPAKALAQTVPGDMAVLSVAGLKRPGITLSNNALSANGTLHLEAFPPAEYIAKGAQPLWMPVKVLSGEDTSQVSISTETPLPYVTGAIIDNCGYLAGVSLTSGPQSLATDQAVPILFGDQIGRILDAMQITLATARCERPVQATEETGVIPVQETRPADNPKMQASAADSQATQTVEPEPADRHVNENKADPNEGNVFDPGQQAIAITPEPPSVWRSVPLWLPLLGIIVLGALIWKGLFYFRQGKNEPGQAALTKSATTVQPASDEPVTAPLESGADQGVLKPRAPPVFDFNIPESSTRPDGCDGVLVVEGLLDSDTGFKRFCFVNTKQIDIILGRGDASISIEHAAISRAHARVESDGELMSLCDLGSRNGTYIGNVPCLPGEIMYFHAEDEISLGEIKLKIHVVRQEAEWA